MTALMFDPWQWIRDNVDEPSAQTDTAPTLATLATLADARAWPLLPIEWRDGLTVLREATPPHRVATTTWKRLVADALALASGWAPHAAALGWSAVDLFGVDGGLVCRPGRAGLVASMEGRKIVAITAVAATIQTPSGGAVRYYRHDLLGAIPIWEVKGAAS